MELIVDGDIHRYMDPVDKDLRCFFLWGQDQIYLHLVGCLCNTKLEEGFLLLGGT